MILGVVGERANRFWSRITPEKALGVEWTALPETIQFLKPPPFGVDSLMASADRWQLDQPGLVAAAKALRHRQLYWNPVHLLVPDCSLGEELERDWAIYVHRLPVEDVTGLLGWIRSASSLRLDRRIHFVDVMVNKVAQELRELYQAAAFGRTDDAAIWERANMVLAEIGAAETLPSCSALASCLLQVRGRGILSQSIRQQLDALIGPAHRAVQQQPRFAVLRDALHRLSNGLRLPRCGSAQQDVIAEGVVHQIQRLLASEQVVGDRRDCIKAIEQHILQKPGVMRQDWLDDLISVSARLAERSSEVIPSSNKNVIQRIVVVEDDELSREAVLTIVKAEGHALPIDSAGDVESATRLLRNGGTALVITDLGLPLKKGQLPVMNGGIRLLQSAEETRRNESPEDDVTSGISNDEQRPASSPAPGRTEQCRHRFIVLTAAEHYSDAIEDALNAGVPLPRFLHKSPSVWRTELPAQICQALLSTATPPPVIEILERTGRIAILDGCEISLDRSLWCTLSILARRPRFWATSTLQAELEHHYGIDFREEPESQIEDYISRLRTSLDSAFRTIHGDPLPAEILECDGGRYRLKARAISMDHVELLVKAPGPPKTMVLEDDPEWRSAIVASLRQAGFEAAAFGAVEDAVVHLLADPPELVSLDLELPRIAGGTPNCENAVDFLRELRLVAPQAGVAVLTSIDWSSGIKSQLLASNIRPEDYHTKGPFGLGQMLASLHRLRQEALVGRPIIGWDLNAPVHPLKIDSERGILVEVAGFPVNPSGEQGKILRVLSRFPNRFVSRQELLETLWPSGTESPEDPDNALDSHIKRLRKEIARATSGKVPGDEVIYTRHRGVCWLWGNIQ